MLRVGCLAAAVARRLRLAETDVDALLRAAPMHDIGKIGVPDRILLKPGKLGANEWQVMTQHTGIGGKILAGSTYHVINLAEVVALTHHEKWDGTGYPRGLKGEASLPWVESWPSPTSSTHSHRSVLTKKRSRSRSRSRSCERAAAALSIPEWLMPPRPRSSGNATSSPASCGGKGCPAIGRGRHVAHCPVCIC